MVWMFTGYTGMFYVMLAVCVFVAAPYSRHSLMPVFLIPLGLLAFGALEIWWMISDQKRQEIRRAIQAGQLRRKTCVLAGAVAAVCVAPLMGLGLVLYNSVVGTDTVAMRRSGIVICVVFLLFAVAPLVPAYWLARRARRSMGG